MVKVKKTLFRFPYIGILLVVVVLIAILFIEKKVTPYVTDSSLTLQTPVLQTTIVDYKPEIPLERKQGTCFSNSNIVSGTTAYRCSVENEIYDPCIVGADGQTLVCQSDPTVKKSGFALDRDGELPEVEEDETEVLRPWVVELASGRLCTLPDTIIPPVGEEEVTYTCVSSNQDRDVVIAGELKQGKLWNAKRVVLDNSERPLSIVQEGIVPLKTVWFVE